MEPDKTSQPTSAPKVPRKRTTVSAKTMEEMDSFKSEGGILSELPSRYRTRTRSTGGLFAVLLLVLLLGGGAYVWYRTRSTAGPQAQTEAHDAAQSQKTPEQLVVEAAAQTASLPQGTPEIITITNPAALAVKDQFFLGALEGDKLLVYRDAHKVFLFSPTRQLMVATADLTPTNSSVDLTPATPTPTLTEQVTATVEIRNGTGTTGLAKQTADRLAGNSSFRVEGIGNAANQSYPKTLVFSLHPEAAPLATQLATVLGGEVVGSLPKEEGLPSTDIVVILGGK